MYMPGDHEDVQHGFHSPESAYQWLLDNCLCLDCRREKELLDKDPNYDTDLPCTAEWLVIKTENYFKKENGEIDWELMDREVNGDEN
jgi:hypothetical protein